MEAAIIAGRLIGVLIVIQMTGAVLVNFVLEAPLFGTPGFLAAAASHSRQIGLAVVLGLMVEALEVGIAIVAFPVFHPRARAIALWLVVLAGAGLAVAVVEGATVMTMVSVSEAYAKASAGQREQFETIRVVVAAARNWPHFIARIFDGLTTFVLYAGLYRLSLIPRALAGFGLIATLLQVTSIAMPFFGHDVVFAMLAPLGLGQLMLAVWLMVFGFRDRDTRPIATTVRAAA
jgi:hypothetical protein